MKTSSVIFSLILLASSAAMAKCPGYCVAPNDGDTFKQRLAASMGEDWCKSNNVIGYHWVEGRGYCVAPNDGDEFKQRLAASMGEEWRTSNNVIGYRWYCE